MCLTQAGMAKKKVQKRMREAEASKVVYVSNGNKINDESGELQAQEERKRQRENAKSYTNRSPCLG